MKAFFLTTVLALGVIAAPAAYAVGDVNAGNISDDFRYDVKDWSAELLALIERGPKVLSKDMIFTIKPFPANSSAETASELAMLQKLSEEARTPEQLAKIQQENALMPLYYAFSQNDLYDFDTHPVTNSLLATVDTDVSYFILREKLAIQRPRPTQLMPALTTVIKVPPHSAYPSGHAGQTYASALVLAELDPVNAEKYKQLAIDIAYRREIAGVHYSSDSEAGRAMATQIVAALMNDPEIQKRVALAKKEFETAQ